MPLSDLACLSALESLDRRAVLPDRCDPHSLASEGLVEPGEAGQWRLTVKGRLVLANLRSLERQRRGG